MTLCSPGLRLFQVIAPDYPCSWLICSIKKTDAPEQIRGTTVKDIQSFPRPLALQHGAEQSLPGLRPSISILGVLP